MFPTFETAANGGALLLHCGLKATLLLLAAITLLFMASRAAAALRHALWLSSCLALLLLPVLTVGLPAWQPALAPQPFAPLPVDTDSVASPSTSPSALTSESPAQDFFFTLAAARSAPNPSAEPNKTEFILAACWGIWALGVSFTALRLALGMRAAQRLQKRGRLISNSEFESAARRLGFSKPPRLYVVADALLPVPLTWGVWKPVVLVPQSALAWPERCRSAAFLHELSHIRRRDWLAQSLASLACILYWFHPLVWFVARQLRLESERATDDRVLAHGIVAVDYGASLLEIVRVLKPTRGGAMLHFAVPMAGSSRLETRLHSLLDPRQQRGAVTKKMLVGVTLLVGAALVPLAAAKEKQADGPDLSTPERAVHSFLAALQRQDDLTALQCVAGGKSVDPFRAELAKRPRYAQSSQFTTGPLKTVIRGNLAQVSGDGNLHWQRRNWGSDRLTKINIPSGPVSLRREAGNWKILPVHDQGKWDRHTDVIARVAASMIHPEGVPQLSAADRTDSGLVVSAVNLMFLSHALPSLLGKTKTIGLKNWQQQDLVVLRRQIRPGTDLSSIFHCPDDENGTESYALNQNLSRLKQSTIFRYGHMPVAIYEGHDGQLDFHHHGRALAVLLDGTVKLVTPDEAKKLDWNVVE